jgi:NADH-quinone oxidoreductase subunit L
VLVGVFVTSLYSFRLVFMTFHGPERFRHAHGHGHAGGEQPATGDPGPGGAVVHASAHGGGHDSHDAHGHGDAHHGEPHESPAVVTLPLIALAIPSVIIGFITIGPMLFGDFFGDAIRVLEKNNVLAEIGHEFHGPVAFALHGFTQPPFFLALGGAVTAWIFFYWKPSLANWVARKFNWLRTILVNKYYFDWINENIIAAASRLLGRSLWRGGDMALIDGGLVNGSAAAVGWFGSIVRHVQSGYLYSYAFWMIIGLAALLGWVLSRALG